MMKKILMLFTALTLMSCNTNKKIPVTNHFDGSFFSNLDGDSKKSFLDVLKWKFTSKAEVWPEINPNEIKNIIPLSKIETGVKVSYLNHSSFLIQTNGINIITDPIWSKRASPFSFLGPKMVYSPAIKKENLPPIDFVIVSHNHYDHMDKESLIYLNETFSPTFIVPLNNAHILDGFGITKVKELDWWESLEISEDSKITLTPARHWSRRGLMDTNQSLWGSFLITSKDKKVYFAGDTGYGIHFKEINKRYGAVDLALLPIGAYEPRWFMKEAHMNPEDAVLAHLDLNSKHSIGMHFGSVQLTDEGIRAPLEDLEIAKKKYNQQNFTTLKSGEDITL